MSDIKELKDEELVKVSGGTGYPMTQVNAGDVFVNDNNGYVVTKTTPITEDDLTMIPCKYIMKVAGQWSSYADTILLAIDLFSTYQYSAELTGTINY